MQQQFFQVFGLAYIAIKRLVYLIFTIAIGNDLRHTLGYAETGLAVAIVLAAFALFDPIVEILLLGSIIALIVLVAYGHCSNPSLQTGVLACGTTAVETAFDAITDTIHRLLGLAHHRFPEVIRA